MNKEASYAVLGLGRYGRKLAVTLAVTGSSILIADRNEEMVNRYADRVTQAVCGDLASEAVLNELGLEHIDIAIVDLSHHLEAAIMAIMSARDHGVKKIIATASTERGKEILEKIGADEVVIPDDDAAVRMARRLISEDFMEYFDLGGGLCVIKTRPQKEWTRKSLAKLQLREKEQINIVAVERDGRMEAAVSPDIVLREDDIVAFTVEKDRIYDFI